MKHSLAVLHNLCRVYLTRSSQGLHLRKSLSLHDSSSATYGCPLPSSAYASTGKAARHHLLGSIAGRLISSSFICPPHWPMGKRLLSSPPGWIGWPRLVSRPKAPAQRSYFPIRSCLLRFGFQHASLLSTEAKVSQCRFVGTVTPTNVFFGHLPILRSALVAVPMKIPRAYLSMEQGGPHLSADVALNSNFLLDFLSYLFLPKPSPPAPPAAPPMPPSFPAPPSSPTTKSADGHDAQSSYYSYGSSEDSARLFSAQLARDTIEGPSVVGLAMICLLLASVALGTLSAAFGSRKCCSSDVVALV
mmetsp:Transcript_23050/g.63081  ORF Transcript_23050/g.63081 Transcript_23050/m.63081 type:complete len:303 (-) Transcript_23050:215-1123(-)